MDKKEKEIFIADMADRLKKARAAFLVDYQGLDVDAMNALRGDLRNSQVEFQVVKNRLLKLACQDTETASIMEHLVGPCALAITYDDAVAPAKVLVEHAKRSDHLKIKAGQIAGKAINGEQIKRLAELPSREVLLAQALSAMQAVPSTFVRTLNAVLVGLMNVLKAVEGQKAEAAN